MPAFACARPGAALLGLGPQAPGLDELSLSALGNGVVMTELHGVDTLTSRESLEAKLIFRDFSQGDKACTGRVELRVELAMSRVCVSLRSAPSQSVTPRSRREKLHGTSVPADDAVNSMAERALATGFHRR